MQRDWMNIHKISQNKEHIFIQSLKQIKHMMNYLLPALVLLFKKIWKNGSQNYWISIDKRLFIVMTKYYR